jgi:hypothetical protein
VRRFGIVLVAACVLTPALGVTAAAAAGNGATQDEFPVSFVMSSDTCPNLPPGTTVTATGTEKSITVLHTNADGGATMQNVSHATGTAVDEAGNTYVFNYSNDFRATAEPADPNTFTGTMSDSFALAGNGPARLTNGFHATFTTDFSTFFSFQPLQARGDPIDFATGAAHCDPL